MKGTLKGLRDREMFPAMGNAIRVRSRTRRVALNRSLYTSPNREALPDIPPEGWMKRAAGCHLNARVQRGRHLRHWSTAARFRQRRRDLAATTPLAASHRKNNRGLADAANVGQPIICRSMMPQLRSRRWLVLALHSGSSVKESLDASSGCCPGHVDCRIGIGV